MGIYFYFSFFQQIAYLGYGTEETLMYKDQTPGSCTIRLRNPEMTYISYEIKVTVSTNNNNIIKTFDGRPNLPISYTTNLVESGCIASNLPYDNVMWDLIRTTGREDVVVNYCPYGVSDPTPYDGVINYKCTSYCVPLDSVCKDENTLLKCRSDGNSIETSICDVKCQSGYCTDLGYNIELTSNKTIYNLGENVDISGRFIQLTTPEVPISGITINAQIIKNNGVVKEANAITDSGGEVKFNLTGITIAGDATIRLSTIYLGKLYEKIKLVSFQGQSLKFDATTYSYIQYDSNPIRFEVVIKDNDERYVYMEKLSNVQVVASLTNGVVKNNSVTYLGNGKYEIISNVEGVGKYVGKMSFTYEGATYNSPIMEISIEKARLSIDTSLISPIAKTGEDNSYQIRIYDSSGNLITPDDINIKVSLPDGTTTKLIKFNELITSSTGVYNYEFIFNQVEKHTFLITVDKEGYVRGSATVSVGVSGAKEMTAGPEWIASVWYILPIGIVVFFVIAFVIYKLVGGKKKK